MFSRTIQAIGETAFPRLQSARVILFGVGGVGGWCAEALVRTGVQHLTIVDFDTIAPSNLNRQVVATAANIGSTKVEQMRARLLSINPQADITALPMRYDADTADCFDFNQYNYILDAIDSLDCKMLLIHRATLSTATLFSSMGAARKYDPARIEVAEFWKVHGCPLARALRTRMKKADLLPAKKFLCAFSPEISADSGTLAPVVGTFGFRLAAEVVKDILKNNTNHSE